MSNAQFDQACIAIHRQSLRERRVFTLKPILMIGLRRILSAGNFKIYLWDKQWRAARGGDDIAVILQLDTEDRKLVQQAKLILQNHSLDKVSVAQTLAIALTAVSDQADASDL